MGMTDICLGPVIVATVGLAISLVRALDTPEHNAGDLEPAGGDDPDFYVYSEEGVRKVAYKGSPMYGAIQASLRRRR